jgi:septin family protein
MFVHKNQINMYVDLKLVSFIKMYTYESLAPFQLKHEFTMVVAGPSKSGKTEFVKQLEQNTLWISPPPEKIVWCYREWQKAYESLQEHSLRR